MQVCPSCPEDDTAVGIEELIAGDKGISDKDEGAEDKVCGDLRDGTVKIRVLVNGVQGKSLGRTKKGILGYIEAPDEQKGKEEEAAERIDDELQKGETKYVEPYVFKKYGVFFTEGYGVEEKKRLVPVHGAYCAGNNKQRYLKEKPGEKYEPEAVVTHGPWPCLFCYSVVPEKDICRT